MENEKYLMNTYSRFPVVLEKGVGMYVSDVNGKKYLDFVAGIAVNALGHSNKKLVAAIEEQAKKLIHCSNLYWTNPQMELAKLLVENSNGMEKVFFCNSGAEAVEASLKLSRKYGNKNSKNQIIAMKNSFHGRTYGAVSATGQDKYHNGFEPLLPGITHVEFNDFTALKNVVSDTTCAIIIEPIQGEGGIISADIEYLSSVRELCNKEDIALIFDEIQCGMGRLGTLFAYQYFDVVPDIVLLAKGLAGGLPIGAVLANGKFANVFQAGDHASTFGGNPLATTAAKTVVSEIINLTDNVSKQGEYLKDKLLQLKNITDCITQIRGIGLMQCIEFNIPVRPIINSCLEKGLLLVSSGDKVIRFVPPLIVSKEDIDEMCHMLGNVLKEGNFQC